MNIATMIIGIESAKVRIQIKVLQGCVDCSFYRAFVLTTPEREESRSPSHASLCAVLPRGSHQGRHPWTSFSLGAGRKGCSTHVPSSNVLCRPSCAQSLEIDYQLCGLGVVWLTLFYRQWRKGRIYGKNELNSMCLHVCYVALVMSDSLRPYGLQPTRLLCPWDSPCKDNGIGCHDLLQGIFQTQGSKLCLLGLPH